MLSEDIEVYDFDFSPVEAFKLLALHGSIPDRYTHQFYATVGELQKRAIDECMVASGMRLLEPNIGLGALLKGLPEGWMLLVLIYTPQLLQLLACAGTSPLMIFYWSSLKIPACLKEF